jgi:periplasmic divalent cation tolerance protein
VYHHCCKEVFHMLFVYITTKDIDEARTIGLALVEERLAACANILPGMESIYHWNGSLCKASETVLIVKTQDNLLDKLTERVKVLHSYSCPCIIALPITGGNSDFIDWIANETGK